MGRAGVPIARRRSGQLGERSLSSADLAPSPAALGLQAGTIVAVPAEGQTLWRIITEATPARADFLSGAELGDPNRGPAILTLGVSMFATRKQAEVDPRPLPTRTARQRSKCPGQSRILDRANRSDTRASHRLGITRRSTRGSACRRRYPLSMVYALVYTDHGDVIEDFASREEARDALHAFVTEHPEVTHRVGLLPFREDGSPGELESARDLLAARHA